MKIKSLDHLVLTVVNVDVACEFYEIVLGMDVITFGEGRKALRFGQQKINLHEVGKEFEPKARIAMVGSADLCFITSTSIEDVLVHLKMCGLVIEMGPVLRTGATQKLMSVYFRDLDENLLEVANLVDG